MEPQTNKSPSVVPRSDIPLALTDGNLEVQPFLAHAILGSVLPQSAVALAWTRARSGKDVALRSHATPGLLIILEGRAILIGGLSRKVEAGDVITLPRHLEYGFTAVGPAGLHALHVAFEGDSESHADEALSLQQLRARNEARLQTTLNNPFFMLLRRRIDSERKREGLRVFAEAFRSLLSTRPAARPEDHASQFEPHLLEGHGQDQLPSATSLLATDSVLRSMSSWLCRQVLVLDGAEKAVVNLVLETAGYYLGALAALMFEAEDSPGCGDTRAEHDEDANVVALEGLQPHEYARLQRVLDTSWDMVDAMTQRFAQLIELDAGSS
jgi:mannose-6-phosphate isomerase-like protein (cupin superfamily)